MARSLTQGEVVVNEDTDVLLGDGTLGVMRVSSAPVRTREFTFSLTSMNRSRSRFVLIPLELDGYQAKQTWDRRGYEKPVTALTAHAMTDERLKTKAAGFAGHLTNRLSHPRSSRPWRVSGKPCIKKLSR